MSVPVHDIMDQGLSIVVFGASGHLARVKILPSLLNLWCCGWLPRHTWIYGLARSKWTTSQWQDSLRDTLTTSTTTDTMQVEEFLSKCFYFCGESYSDVNAYQRLEEFILQQEEAQQSLFMKHNRIFYLAIPPNVFVETVMAIHKTFMQSPTKGFTRIIIEKPFGRDLPSYTQLQQVLSRYWNESQIVRMDHYLGKSMVQGLLALRMNNEWLERLWSRDSIQCVYIVWKEQQSLANRGGGYFDSFGIICDVIQNHLLQILMLIAMELPQSMESNNVNHNKVQVLQHMAPMEPQNVLLGQYQGYREHVQNATSTTSTFALVACRVDAPRWKDIPFLMEAGKAVDKSVCEIRLIFHSSNATLPSNELVLRIQPNPGMFIRTNTQIPGLHNSSQVVSAPLAMEFETLFPNFVDDAYSNLLLDVLRGRRESFVQNDELKLSWQLVGPILTHSNIPMELYEQGSSGPPGRRAFLERMGIQYDNNGIEARWGYSDENQAVKLRSSL